MNSETQQTTGECGGGESTPVADDPDPCCCADWTETDERRDGDRLVEVVDSCGLGVELCGWLGARGTEALERLGVAGEARVRLIEDEEMAAAHLAHCGVGGTTDVITFDMLEGAGLESNRIDADLLVCVDEGRRQAEARGHALRRELLLYVVHGMLHCLGHGDTDEASWRAMHTREDEVLERIGVGATFGVDRADR